MSELSNLVELLGADVAMILMETYGGTRLPVPKVIPADHELRKILSSDDIKRLITYFAGSSLLVPLARSWRAPIYRRQGLTFREIARKLGCTETAAYRYLAAAKIDERQMALFHEEK
jgi:hypothetical protein